MYETHHVDALKCDRTGCENKGDVTSRLSPEGFLVATGNQAYSFREAYVQHNYCKKCHAELMHSVWARVNQDSYKKDDHVAPTAV